MKLTNVNTFFVLMYSYIVAIDMLALKAMSNLSSLGKSDFFTSTNYFPLQALCTAGLVFVVTFGSNFL